jgi:hypothetical protein
MRRFRLASLHNSQIPLRLTTRKRLKLQLVSKRRSRWWTHSPQDGPEAADLPFEVKAKLVVEFRFYCVTAEQRS